ncbi:hypothetical protein H5410_033851, partial [Solanum commersonii]
VFEVLVEKGTKGPKRTKKRRPEDHRVYLANRLRDVLRPLFYTVQPNDPECEDTEGDELTKRRITEFIGDPD